MLWLVVTLHHARADALLDGGREGLAGDLLRGLGDARRFRGGRRRARCEK